MNFAPESMMPPNASGAFGQPQQQQQQQIPQQQLPQVQQQQQQKTYPQAIMSSTPRTQQDGFGSAPFLPPPPAKSGRPQPQMGGMGGMGMPQQQPQAEGAFGAAQPQNGMPTSTAPSGAFGAFANDGNFEKCLSSSQKI